MDQQDTAESKVKYVVIDSKSDDADLFRELKRLRKVNMITYCRVNVYKTTVRKKMIKFLNQPKHRKINRQRAYKGEPMHGLVKDIFEIDRCWMRGNENNRWLFASMGVAVQMH